MSDDHDGRDTEVLVAAARAVMAAFRLQLDAKHLPVHGAAALHLLACALQPYEDDKDAPVAQARRKARGLLPRPRRNGTP